MRPSARSLSTRVEIRPRLNFCRRKSLSGHRLTTRPTGLASFRRSNLSHNVRRHITPLRIRKSPQTRGIFNMRRGRDSNSRWGYPHAGFRNRCLRPLSHLSLGPTKVGPGEQSPCDCFSLGRAGKRARMLLGKSERTIFANAKIATICPRTKIPFFLLLSQKIVIYGRKRPHRLTVRTPAFQAVNRGSIPRGVTDFPTIFRATFF